MNTSSPVEDNGGLVRSRYLLISPNRYRTGNGTVVRLAYATRTAKLLTLEDETVGRIDGGDLTSLATERLAALADAKALVDPAEDEFAAVLGQLESGSRDLSTRQITIMPTAYCNMACSYCGQEHHKAAVNTDRMNRMAERVERVIADPEVKRLRVVWFGGEPLLAFRVIREMSERFVAAAAEHGTEYEASMATNGSLLTTRTLDSLYHSCRLRSMDVTIDGPEETHDARRLKRNGQGSFHRAVSILSTMLKERRAPDLRLNIRVNIDHANEATVSELLLDLACFGFGCDQVRLELMPVHSWGNDVSAVELGLQRYGSKEADWLRLAHDLGIGFTVLPANVKRSTCLATMKGGELLDSAGSVYSCSEHPLVPVARDTGVIATVDDLTGSAPRPAGAFDDWYSSVRGGQVPCARCPLLPVCGGMCPKLWRESHVPCPSMKQNWADRMDLAAMKRGYQKIDA